MNISLDVAKALLIPTALLIFVALGSSLSCASSEPELHTIHCPKEASCDNSLNPRGKYTLDVNLSTEEIPEAGESYTKNSSEQPRLTTRAQKVKFSTVDNTNLPSQKEALKSAKSMCPDAAHKHLYPKKHFSEENLSDTTRCYKTQIEASNDYYLVWREGTTEGWNCVEKVRGRMVAGGKTRYVAPAGPLDYLGLFFKLLF